LASDSIEPKKVLEALRRVKDPDLNKDVVSLGFIKNLVVSGGRVSFELSMATPDSSVREKLRAECERNIREIKGVSHLAIGLTDPRAPRRPSSGISLPGVKNVVAVASGKGGVGKSTVAVNLALALAEKNTPVGLLDADVYGPSIPMMLGISGQPDITEAKKIIPKKAHNIEVMSMGFLAHENTPVIWRGPMVHSLIQQFLGGVAWGDLDTLVIDCPPGTGDAILTLTQSAPLTGAVIVTTPQDVSLIDARKGLKMFRQVKVPVLGIIENMSYYECGHCHEKEFLFRHGGGQKLCHEEKVPFLGEIPIDPEVVIGGDEGLPILAKNPESPAAVAFHQVAGRLREEIARSKVSEKGPEDLSLTWR